MSAILWSEIRTGLSFFLLVALFRWCLWALRNISPALGNAAATHSTVRPLLNAVSGVLNNTDLQFKGKRDIRYFCLPGFNLRCITSFQHIKKKGKNPSIILLSIVYPYWFFSISTFQRFSSHIFDLQFCENIYIRNKSWDGMRPSLASTNSFPPLVRPH